MLTVENKESVKTAFNRISHTCIDVVGDDCKDDLTLVGETIGFSRTELEETFPELFTRGEVDELDESYENLDQDENDQDENESTEE